MTRKIEDVAIARSVLDLAIQFVSTVEEAGGTIEDAQRAMFKDELLKKRIGLFVMNRLKLEGFPCQKNVPHLIPDYIVEVIEDVEPTQLDPKDLKFMSFMRDGDGKYIDGETMRTRAVELNGNLGLCDVPSLLGEDSKGIETIPEGMRGEKYIVLPGTLLRRSLGGLCVPCLYWSGDEWCLYFYWLGHDWHDYDVVASCE